MLQHTSQAFIKSIVIAKSRSSQLWCVEWQFFEFSHFVYYSCLLQAYSAIVFQLKFWFLFHNCTYQYLICCRGLESSLGCHFPIFCPQMESFQAFGITISSKNIFVLFTVSKRFKIASKHKRNEEKRLGINGDMDGFLSRRRFY